MFLPIEILYNIGQHLGVMEREVLKLPPRKLASRRVSDLEDMLKAAHCDTQWDKMLIITLFLKYDYHRSLYRPSHLYELQRDIDGYVRVLAYTHDDLKVIWDSKAL
jgi:hypothetical protein